MNIDNRINLAIIIVNYKNESLTIHYIKEELKKITIPYVTIIVNNSATTESNNLLINNIGAILIDDASIVLNLNSNEIENRAFVISSKDNLGFAKANNLGVRFVNSNFNPEFILFSNNDIKIISDDVVEQLIDKMNEHADIGMIGPNCVDINNISRSPYPFVPFYIKWLAFWLSPFMSDKRKKQLWHEDYPKEALEGDHYKISGSFFIVRNIYFIQCGMMDPNTFLYCEEEILTERFYDIGKRVYYYPNVKIMHEESQTTSKFIDDKRKRKLTYESSSYYYHKYKNVSLFAVFLGRISCFLFPYLKAIESKFITKRNEIES